MIAGLQERGEERRNRVLFRYFHSSGKFPQPPEATCTQWLSQDCSLFAGKKPRQTKLAPHPVQWRDHCRIQIQISPSNTNLFYCLDLFLWISALNHTSNTCYQIRDLLHLSSSEKQIPDRISPVLGHSLVSRCRYKLKGSVQYANILYYSPRCPVGWLTVKSGGSLECGWNPFCRQEEISSRPCSVSLKNPVLEQINTCSVQLKPLQIKAAASVFERACLNLLVSSTRYNTCCSMLFSKSVAADWPPFMGGQSDMILPEPAQKSHWIIHSFCLFW